MKIKAVYTNYTGIYNKNEMLLYMNATGDLLKYELTTPLKRIYGNLPFERIYKI